MVSTLQPFQRLPGSSVSLRHACPRSVVPRWGSRTAPRHETAPLRNPQPPPRRPRSYLPTSSDRRREPMNRQGDSSCFPPRFLEWATGHKLLFSHFPVNLALPALAPTRAPNVATNQMARSIGGRDRCHCPPIGRSTKFLPITSCPCSTV